MINKPTTLKPCPFCGGTNLRKDSKTSGFNDYTDGIVCECGAALYDYYGKPEEKWDCREVKPVSEKRILELAKKYFIGTCSWGEFIDADAMKTLELERNELLGFVREIEKEVLGDV